MSARTELDWGTVVPHDPYYGNGYLDAFAAVLAWSTGDLDCSGDIDITDLVIMVDYMFKGGEPPESTLRLADIDCDGSVDIGDLVGLVSYMFDNFVGYWPCYLK